MKSLQEAIARTTRFLTALGKGECELRQVFEPSDFAPESFPPEQVAREDALREEMQRRAQRR